ncbi:MAG: hypothetical protein HOE82_08505 [Gammaproteobacteria bacterium]|jgi:hypothetical protein|nr:hypothetical protein [Gammaproteobacteria bacterium]
MEPVETPVDDTTEEDRGDFIPNTEVEEESTPVETDTSEPEVTEAETETETETVLETTSAESETATETETASESETAVAPATRTDENMIPKDRMDVLIEKNRILEAQVAKQHAEENKPNAPEFDFESKEEQYMDAVLDGDKTKAKQLRGEIRNAEREQYQFEQTQVTGYTLAQAKEQREFDTSVAGMIDTYDIYNPESADYNNAFVEQTNIIMQGYLSAGYTRSDALGKAADAAIRAFHPELLESETSLGEPTTAVEPVQPKVEQTQVKEKVAASNKQPPKAGGISGSSDGKGVVVDISKLTDSQFDSMIDKEPETYHDLRGDYVA